jgi:hypothetical protein
MNPKRSQLTYGASGKSQDTTRFICRARRQGRFPVNLKSFTRKVSNLAAFRLFATPSVVRDRKPQSFGEPSGLVALRLFKTADFG